MVDTHCHLNFHSFKKTYHEVAQNAHDACVTKIINVGAKLDSSRRAVKIANEIPFCFAAVGVHPTHVEDYSDLSFVEKELAQIIEEDKNGSHKIVAIGETGLDYHMFFVGEGLSTLTMGRVTNPPLREKIKEAQMEMFKLHLRLAQKFHLPLILHCRDAYSDLFGLLRTTNYVLRTPSVLHCFQGTLADLKEFLNLGFYIGYDGYITYAKNYEELVRATPLNRILTETDAPWLTPEPLRGTLNTPANIKIICEKIAQIKGVVFEDVDKITSENAKKILSL